MIELDRAASSPRRQALRQLMDRRHQMQNGQL
jgi:hypothetical protein